MFLDLQYLPNFNISETTSASSSYRPRMVDVTQHYAAFAICRPLTTKSLVKEQGNATCPKQIPVCRAHRRSRQRRKRGALPPVVPITLLARQRAIDLLGHYTQRRPSAKILSELSALLGRSPTDRMMAGRWKDGLQSILRKEKYQKRPKRSEKVLEVSRAVTHIPLREYDVGRTFSILEVSRRILAQGRVLSLPLSTELRKHLGTAPRTEREAMIVRKELSRRIAARKKLELLPPRIDDKMLPYISMHLGLLTKRYHIGGRRARKLGKLLGGTLPRNQNVAKSWKSIVDKRRKKIAHKQIVEQNLAVADAKRRRRKRWKMAPEWTKEICRIGNRMRKRLFKAFGLSWKKK